MQTGSFNLLTPEAIIPSIEQAYGLKLDGTVTPFPSYINRVYGLRTDEGEGLVAKFYRPGRWSWDAILDEHDFIADCAGMEIPVAVPLDDIDGDTLCEVTVADQDGEESYSFALFPQMGGRNFDAENDEDYYRLGTVVGRCHVAGKKRDAENRSRIHPAASTRSYLDELGQSGLIHPECRDEFEEICLNLIDTITPLFDGTPAQRLHGDCHRGNILDRGDEGLLLYDFDDMATGPPVQDLWLLLPDYTKHCRRELLNTLDGYTQFCSFNTESLRLIEPLRFMRIVYFLVWRARQSGDYWFRIHFPDWGTEAFWIKEVEDIKVQRDIISEALDDEGGIIEEF